MDFDKVKELRGRTQASMSACKRVLEQCGGDVERAVVALQRSGEAKVADFGKRVAAEGRVYTYRHPGDRLAVVVEVNCQTDFVARSAEFGELCEELAMQIAGMGAKYVSKSEIPADVLHARQNELADAAMSSGLEGDRAVSAVDSGVARWVRDVCLLEQPLLADPSTTVGQRVVSYAARVGEKIDVRRFVRWELAEGVDRKVEDYAAEVAKVASGSA